MGDAAEAAHQQAHQAAAGAAAAAAAAASADEAINSAMGGLSMSGSEDYLKNVGNFVAAALDPLGIDVKIDIETPEGRKSCHVSRQTSTTTEQTGAAEDAKKDGGTEQQEEAAEKKDNAAEPESSKKSNPPSDDEEDWTVVSDKKAAEDSTPESLYPDLTETPSAPPTTASHPRPQDPGGAPGHDEHGLHQRWRLADLPPGGQEWRHWQGTRHPPASQEIN